MTKNNFINSKWFTIGVILLFAAIPPIFYSGLLNDGLILVSGDGAGYYTMRSFFNTELWSGGFPMWNKYLEGGMPYGAYDSVGLYPVAIILSVFSPAVFSYLYYFVHLFIGAVFFYFFLNELKFSKNTALIVSLLYELSVHLNGYRKDHIMLIVGIVYLPVILYFIQKFLNTKDLKWLIISAVAMGFQFLGAHTQVVLYTDGLAFVYLIIYEIRNKFNAKKAILYDALWLITYIAVIFAQLYATVVLFADINNYGAEGNSFENFKSYSIHAIKLLQMALPYVFGDNINQTLGSGYSSEMDIELFLGLFVLICLVFCVCRLLKKFEVKLYLSIMAAIFAYSSLAHIPFLADIVYKIPILNGFRVPSRALFIFIFFAFMLLAEFIEEVKNNESMEKFVVFGKKTAIVGIAAISLVLVCVLFFADTEEAMKTELQRFIKVFIPAVIVLAVILAVSVCHKIIVKKRGRSEIFYGIFCVVLAVSTLAETYPFSSNTSSLPAAYFDSENSPVEAEISASDYKVLDAFSSIDGAHAGMIGLNAGVHKKIMGINSYLTYNNPRLYQLMTGNESMPLNYSGLFSGFPNMEEILKSKNDLLSVLGVKYIIDSSGILENDAGFYQDLTLDEQVIAVEEELYFPATSEYNVYSCPIQTDTDDFIKVEFDLETSGELSFAYLDMVSEAGVDGYNRIISFSEDQNHYTSYYKIPSEAESGNRSLRVVFQNTQDAVIRNFSVYQKANDVTDENAILSEPAATLPACQPGAYSLIQYPAELDPNEYYLISFDAYSDSVPQMLYADFWAEGYDSNDQQVDIIIPAGQKESCSYVINSGDCPDSALLRFVSISGTDISLDNIVLKPMDKSGFGFYSKYYSDEAQTIYLNENAKDILFINPEVKPLESGEEIYKCVEEYDLLNVSYVKDFDKSLDLSDSESSIEDIDFKTNSISAKVVSDKDTFMNFSQSYYKGWSAYVDGKSVPLYIVDDVIMGAEVPAGEHVVEFRYSIPFFGAAIVISVGAIAFWVIYFVVRDKKNIKASAQDKE